MPACKRVAPSRRKQGGEVEDGQMHIAFLNPQGNFDPRNSYLASHPDFGGQLVYVREVARTLGKMGHHADILTRRIVDPDWPEFASDTDAYPDTPNVRILRVLCGPDRFLPKEELWSYLSGPLRGRRARRSPARGGFRRSVYLYGPFAGSVETGLLATGLRRSRRLAEGRCRVQLRL
jgi:hypothetical protein